MIQWEVMGPGVFVRKPDERKYTDAENQAWIATFLKDIEAKRGRSEVKPWEDESGQRKMISFSALM